MAGSAKRTRMEEDTEVGEMAVEVHVPVNNANTPDSHYEFMKMTMPTNPFKLGR